MTHTPKILVVEDQYFVAIDCELNLRSGGFECVGLATTAADAVELAEREHPDLIVMDIRLAGGADGVDAAILIFERLGIRCIFASGHADAAVRQIAERARPLGWLDKPYTCSALIQAVREGVAALETEPRAARPRASQAALH
ncbi:MAG: response regulator [Steroidobacter sp.]